MDPAAFGRPRVTPAARIPLAANKPGSLAAPERLVQQELAGITGELADLSEMAPLPQRPAVRGLEHSGVDGDRVGRPISSFYIAASHDPEQPPPGVGHDQRAYLSPPESRDELSDREMRADRGGTRLHHRFDVRGGVFAVQA